MEWGLDIWIVQLAVGFIGVVLMAFYGIQIFSLIYMMTPDPTQGPLLSPEVGETSMAKDYPRVSLLLAARNEEKLIERSLQSIDQLDYPKDRIQVLIGDDNSTDRTAYLVEKFIQGKPEYKLIEVTTIKGKGRGKANVLAHLAEQANGEFFFITDVDVKLPQGWIKGLRGNLKRE